MKSFHIITPWNSLMKVIWTVTLSYFTGALPKDASFSMHAMIINHYLYGASYPRGGASEIAFHMIPIIERSGGKVLMRAQVKEILVEDGKAVGK